MSEPDEVRDDDQQYEDNVTRSVVYQLRFRLVGFGSSVATRLVVAESGIVGGGSGGFSVATFFVVIPLILINGSVENGELLLLYCEETEWGFVYKLITKRTRENYVPWKRVPEG